MFLFSDVHEPAWDPSPLHTMTLTQVLAMPDAPLWAEGHHEKLVAAGMCNMDRHAWSVIENATPCGVEGYVIGQWGDWRRGWLIAFDTETMKPVGGVFDRIYYVVPEHRGHGLGAEILVRAYETGIKHPLDDQDHFLTMSARRAMVSAHRKAVERALSDGLEVEPDVLADYPDLRPEEPASQPAPPRP